MSETMKKIREAWISKRKNKNEKLPDSAFIGMLVAECSMIGKNKNPSRDTTEEEVLKHVEKVLKSSKELFEYSNDAISKTEIQKEISFMENLLPEKVSKEELTKFITENCQNMQIGQAMGLIKKEYGATVDMKLASTILKGLN